MTIVLRSKFDFSKEFERFHSLLPLAHAVEDKNVRGKYFRTFSNLHRHIGNTDSALYYETMALQAFEDAQNLSKVAEIRASRISRVHGQYLKEGKRVKILELIPKYEAEIAFSGNHSKYVLSYNTRHLAQIYRRQTDMNEEALKLFKTSLQLREEIGFKLFLPASYSSLGDVYLKMGEHLSAKEMYLKSSKLAGEIGFLRYQCYPLLCMGDIYLKQGNKDKARDYYTSSLRVAEQGSYTQGVDEAMKRIEELGSQ